MPIVAEREILPNSHMDAASSRTQSSGSCNDAVCQTISSLLIWILESEGEFCCRQAKCYAILISLPIKFLGKKPNNFAYKVDYAVYWKQRSRKVYGRTTHVTSICRMLFEE